MLFRKFLKTNESVFFSGPLKKKYKATMIAVKSAHPNKGYKTPKKYDLVTQHQATWYVPRNFAVWLGLEGPWPLITPSFSGIGFCVGLKLEVLRDQVSKVYFCNRHKPQMSKITIPNVYMMHIWSVWWVFKRYMTGAKIITGRKFGWLRNVHGLLHGVQLDGVSWSIVYCIPIALVPPQEVARD